MMRENILSTVISVLVQMVNWLEKRRKYPGQRVLLWHYPDRYSKDLEDLTKFMSEATLRTSTCVKEPKG